MSWLDKAHEEAEKAPHWLERVVTHERFNALHREGGRWVLYPGEDDALEADDLREVCEAFTARYG